MKLNLENFKMKKYKIIDTEDIHQALQEDQSDNDDHEEEHYDETDMDDDDDDDDDDIDDDADRATTTTQKLKRPPKFNVEKNNRTIFVGNLPKDISTRGIKRIFRECGQIESIRIRSVAPEKKKLSKKVAAITKQMHGRVASFNAYVVFKSNEDDKNVKAALAKNGQEIDGHHIRVDRASKPKSLKHKVKVSRKKSIFIGNLPFDVKDDEVYKFFEKVGPIDSIRIIRDPATRIGKGFGFVSFQDRATVPKAIQLNDHRFGKRAIRVTKVVDETSLSGGGQVQAPKSKKPKLKPKPTRSKVLFKALANKQAASIE